MAACATVAIVMPVWTPGSYLVREFERNVQDFAATDAAGQSLNWEKTKYMPKLVRLVFLL